MMSQTNLEYYKPLEITITGKYGSGNSGNGMTYVDGNWGATLRAINQGVSEMRGQTLYPSGASGTGVSEGLSNVLNGIDSNPVKKCDDKRELTSSQKTKAASNSKPSKTSHAFNNKVSVGNVDKRVALTVAPRTANTNDSYFVDKVIQVLGQKSMTPNWVLAGSKFYGLLRNALGTTSGLIFPYTPKVSFSHSVEYDKTSITHTNLSYNYYKSTPPPSISLDGKFTADNRQNALHMLSAIWFLTACSKCDFGENAANPGLPPPILYLSGYNSLIDNIPVVITGFNYTYPDEKHYVNLVLDMSKDNNIVDSGFCKVYDYTTTIESYGESRTTQSSLTTVGGTTTINSKGEVVHSDSIVIEEKGGTTSSVKYTQSKDGGINLSFWLPTELDIHVEFAIQPNMIKHKKQWSLSRYQSGYLLTNRGKNPSVSLDTMDTQTIMKEDYDASCNKIQVPTEVEKKETLNFIPSGWTW